MGNGKLFLPVKASIRKQILKEAGDTVQIVLFLDEDPLTTPQEILACFENEPPETLQTYNNLTEGERKAYLDWIFAAKTDRTRIDRILKMMARLAEKKTLYD